MSIVSLRGARRLFTAALVLSPAIVSAQGPANTGQNSSFVGNFQPIDLNWNFSFQGSPLAPAFLLPRFSGPIQWIDVANGGNVPGGQADSFLSRFTYTFETQFSGQGLSGFSYQCAVDDLMGSVTLNGTTIGGTGACGQYNFGATQFVSSGIDAGTNDLVFTTMGNGVTDGFAFDVTGTSVTAAPEPATIALFATGLIGVAGFARCRRKA